MFFVSSSGAYTDNGGNDGSGTEVGTHDMVVVAKVKIKIRNGILVVMVIVIMMVVDMIVVIVVIV